MVKASLPNSVSSLPPISCMNIRLPSRTVQRVLLANVDVEIEIAAQTEGDSS